MMGAQIALSAVSSFAQASQAKKQAHATADAARDSANLRMSELTRQQEETNRVAREDRSDIMRRADQELGAIRVAAGEVGATDSSFARMVQELGYVEGLDLSRIESNRKARIDALQSAKTSTRQDYLNTTTQAFNQAKAATTNAILGFVGSALQIGASYNRQSRIEEIYRNRT
jgi:HAMP domain-containing protein